MRTSRRNFIKTATLFAAAPVTLRLTPDAKAKADDATPFVFSRANLSFASSNDVGFAGYFGTKYKQSLDRLSGAPIDNAPFVLDDVNFNQKRRFFNYSGDISGRYIEIASLASRKDAPITPILPQIVDEIVKYQQPDGHYGREVDWNKPIDVAGSTDQSLEMPILWGNGRLMLGLFAAYERFGNEKALESAKKMADFYVNIVVKRFCDPQRMDEYKQKAKGYAAAYVTCVFHGIEGLVRAYRVTKEKKYLECAVQMADFHEEFDELPVGHSHGSISAHEALVMLYEETNDKKYLDRATKRWNDAVYGGFVNPGGGVCENYIVEGHSDEGCSEADWLRICLMLWRNTGDSTYLDFAERMLYNEYLMNQWRTGGFGHRYMISDENGCYAWGERYAESYWCCSYHGPLGYYELKEFLAVGAVDPKTKDNLVYYNFPLEFTTPFELQGARWQIMSRQIESKPSSPIRTVVTIAGPQNAPIKFIARKPDWAQEVRFTRGDESVEAKLVGSYYVVDVKVGDALELEYRAVPFIEDRRFHKIDLAPNVEKIEQCVLRYGPNVLVSISKDAPKIDDITLVLDENNVVQLPESSTCPYEMSEDERCEKSVFVFNASLKRKGN